MRAASAKAASFWFSFVVADMILVKFTNCTSITLLSEQGMNIAAESVNAFMKLGLNPRLCQLRERTIIMEKNYQNNRVNVILAKTVITYNEYCHNQKSMPRKVDVRITK